MKFEKPASWINPPKKNDVPHRIVIEGLIGVGKTFFSKDLAKELEYHLMEEPVAENKLLPLFYSDPKRFAFAMQVKMLTERLSMERAGTYMVEAGVVPGVVYDRSLGGDAVFMELNTVLGNIAPEEAEVYLRLFGQMKIESPYPDLIIFLEASLDTVRWRIKGRGRPFEKSILDEGNHYLEGLQEGYDRFLEAMGYHTCVVRLDWEKFRSASSVWSEIKEKYEASQESRCQKMLLEWNDHA